MTKIIEDIQRDIRNLKTKFCCLSNNLVLEITKTELDTLISNDSLIPGQLYKISNVDVPLYGGTEVLIKAATTNELESSGHGIFYNPKYLNSRFTPENGYGIYDKYVFYRHISGVNSFGNGGQTVTANNGATGKFRSRGAIEYISGDWSTATSFSFGAASSVIEIISVPTTYSINNNVIWGGKHWTNKIGNAGSSIDDFTLDSTNWQVVPFNDTDYNIEIDQISYDYQNDLIVSRKDRWNNTVTFTKNTNVSYSPPINPIKIFQWGNYPEDNNTNTWKAPGVTNNTVIDSIMLCINFTGVSLKDSIITAGGDLSLTITDKKSIIVNTVLSNAYFWGNTLTNTIISATNAATYSAFYRNVCIDAYIENNNLDNGNINDNYCEYTTIQYNDFRQSYINNSFFKNYFTLDACYFKYSGFYQGFWDGITIEKSTFDFSDMRILGASFIDKQIKKLKVEHAPINTDMSSATIIFGNYPKQIFTNSSGTMRLGYYNGSDVFTIVNINA